MSDFQETADRDGVPRMPDGRRFSERVHENRYAATTPLTATTPLMGTAPTPVSTTALAHQELS